MVIADFTDHEIALTVKENIVGSPSGVSAVFVPINDNWAIKLFNCPEHRNEVYETQKRCAKYGLAPQVAYKLDLPGPPVPIINMDEMDDEDFDPEYDENGVPRHYYHYHIYGYMTQIIETVCDDECTAWDWYQAHESECDVVVSRLYNECDWEFTDKHGMNWGRLKCGQLVPIDFGEE